MFDEMFNQGDVEKREIEMTDEDVFHAIVGLVEVGGIGEAYNIFEQAIESAENSDNREGDGDGVDIPIDDDDEKYLWEKQRDDEVRAYVLESQAEDVTGLKFILATGYDDALSKAQTAGVPYEVWGTMAELHGELGRLGQLDFTTAQHDYYDEDDEE